MSTIGITGGTGFVGQRLALHLTGLGYKVISFNRRIPDTPAPEGVQYAYWNPDENKCDLTALTQIDGIVHLAGANLAEKRWSKKRKEVIVTSRVPATDFLVSQLRLHAKSCKVLISASAVGYYGPDRNTPPFTEDAPAYHDFLGTTCAKWEEAALGATDFMRVVIFRNGIVLGKDKGAFAEFEKPMNWGVMPILGSGRQMVSWIHIDDVCQMTRFALEHEDVKGIFNAVAPQPVAHKHLMQTIAKAKGGIKIPAPVPALAIRLALGELSNELLKSCTVSAEKITRAGYQFIHPTIEEAARTIVAEERAE